MENNNKPSQPALLRRSEAWRALAIGPSKYKDLVNSGALCEVSIGERGRRLPLSEVQRYISERLAEHRK